MAAAAFAENRAGCLRPTAKKSRGWSPLPRFGTCRIVAGNNDRADTPVSLLEESLRSKQDSCQDGCPMFARLGCPRYGRSMAPRERIYLPWSLIFSPTSLIPCPTASERPPSRGSSDTQLPPCAPLRSACRQSDGRRCCDQVELCRKSCAARWLVSSPRRACPAR